MKKYLAVILIISLGLVWFLTRRQPQRRNMQQQIQQQQPQQQVKASTQPSVTSGYAMSEVKTHNAKSDCWMVIEGSVYNVSKYVSIHPGGDQILLGCGADATAMFNNIGKHFGASRILSTMKIGSLATN